MTPRFGSFDSACSWSEAQLKAGGVAVDTGRWQGISTVGKPDLVTKELLNLQFEVRIPNTAEALADDVRPNLPWAEDHFQERVGGEPMNPDPSYQDWPWWHGGFQEAQSMIPSQQEGGEFKFTHTYSERFWPKKSSAEHREWGTEPLFGIRYDYGDYEDVLDLLAEDPYTRQAYLPIFFPEDTGAVHRGRIPCSLGYHFLLRDGRLHCWYDIRSCDAVRHFRDDLYLAARLVQHTIHRQAEIAFAHEVEGEYDPWLEPVKPGTLFFTAHSFHAHMGDWHRL